MKRDNLDELQLIKRGNVFQHGFVALILLLFTDFMLYAAGIEWASERRSEMTIVLFVIVMIQIEMICYEIYPLTEKRQRVLIYILGLFGVIYSAVCGYDLMIGRAELIAEGKITDEALGLLCGIMFLSVTIVYVIKKRLASTHEREED